MLKSKQISRLRDFKQKKPKKSHEPTGVQQDCSTKAQSFSKKLQFWPKIRKSSRKVAQILNYQHLKALRLHQSSLQIPENALQKIVRYYTLEKYHRFFNNCVISCRNFKQIRRFHWFCWKFVQIECKKSEFVGPIGLLRRNLDHLPNPTSLGSLKLLQWNQSQVKLNQIRSNKVQEVQFSLEFLKISKKTPTKVV